MSTSRRPRRLVRLCLAGILGVLVLGLCWLAVTAELANRQESATQKAVAQLRSAIADADVTQAKTAAAAIGSHARSAHRLTTGPAWWVAAHLPWAGRPVESIRGSADQADQLDSGVLTPLVNVADTLNISRLVSHGSVRLQPLVAAAPVLDRAVLNLRASSARVQALPHNTWLGSVDDARQGLQNSLAKLQTQLGPVSQTADLLPPLLGNTGTKRYFVGLENEAESRGLGGIPGAFAIVTASHGTISFTRFESDTTLDKVRTGLDLGPQYAQRYRAADPTDSYPNSTISPDFTDAARIWAAMWQKYSGQHIDGAAAIDPTAIAYLLKVTGPATLSGGGTVDASNVVALTQKTLYRTHPDTAARKAYLLQIADAISVRLLSAQGNTALIRAAAHAASERRIVLWSADPSVQKTLARTAISGTLDARDGYFAGFATVNATGGKLDYYLKRTMSYTRTGCTAGSISTSTFTLTNAVPAGDLPSYVTIRADNPTYPVRPGDNKVLLSYYGTPGSRVTGVTVDGKKTLVAQTGEDSLAVFTLPLELARGSSHTVTVSAVEPARAGSTTIMRQPSVSMLTLTKKLPPCG